MEKVLPHVSNNHGINVHPFCLGIQHIIILIHFPLNLWCLRWLVHDWFICKTSFTVWFGTKDVAHVFTYVLSRYQGWGDYTRQDVHTDWGRMSGCLCERSHGSDQWQLLCEYSLPLPLCAAVNQTRQGQIDQIRLRCAISNQFKHFRFLSFLPSK